MLIKAWSLTTNQKPEKTDKSLIIKIKPIKYQRYSLDYECSTSYKSQWYLTKHMKNNSFFSFFGGEEEFEIWPSFVTYTLYLHLHNQWSITLIHHLLVLVGLILHGKSGVSDQLMSTITFWNVKYDICIDQNT